MHTLRSRRPWLAAAFGFTLALAACAPGDDGGDAEAYPTDDMRLMAPADPGGGWDSTARALQPVVEEVGGIGAEVYNVGGAGGTIGLAEFAQDQAGNPHELMVMGLVMVGAIETNDSATTLENVTPIASLTSEQEAIVVQADSEFQTLEDLVNAWIADPTGISWAGGSAGGTDHILVGLLAQAAGVDPTQINYVPHSGGGEAITAILSGSVSAGVSGVGEFIEQVEAGEMRWLAVSGEAAPEGIDAPTIAESGYDVVLENWRGIVAPPDISDGERDAIVAFITEVRDSDAWATKLDENGWADFFQSGDDFATFLEEERARIEAILADLNLGGS